MIVQAPYTGPRDAFDHPWNNVIHLRILVANEDDLT